VDTRPVLGLSDLRPAFLDHVPAAGPAETQAGHGADHMIRVHPDDDSGDDDFDDDFDEDEDEDDDDGEGDDEEDEEEDVETWQVSNPRENRRSFA
jgi:hypothetical protein